MGTGIEGLQKEPAHLLSSSLAVVFKCKSRERKDTKNRSQSTGFLCIIVLHNSVQQWYLCYTIFIDFILLSNSKIYSH